MPQPTRQFPLWIQPLAVTLDETGGAVALRVSALPTLQWRAVPSQQSGDAWLTFTTPLAGTGSGAINAMAVPLPTGVDHRQASLTFLELKSAGSSVQVSSAEALATAFVSQYRNTMEQAVSEMSGPTIIDSGITAWVKQIKQLPPEAQPPAFLLVLAAIEAGEVAALALVQAFPEIPHAYSDTFIQTVAAEVRKAAEKEMEQG